eukprot:scaffold83985_cov48-Phaeocystis_antarctica.AAC.1
MRGHSALGVPTESTAQQTPVPGGHRGNWDSGSVRLESLPSRAQPGVTGDGPLSLMRPGQICTGVSSL